MQTLVHYAYSEFDQLFAVTDCKPSTPLEELFTDTPAVDPCAMIPPPTTTINVAEETSVVEVGLDAPVHDTTIASP